VPDPETEKSMAERMSERGEPGPPYKFWENIDSRPVEWRDEWPPTESLEPYWQQWERFIPTDTFDDPWLDACRSVIWIDLSGWPAANGRYAWRTLRGSR